MIVSGDAALGSSRRGTARAGRAYAAVLAALWIGCVAQYARAQQPCEDAMFIHNYPVLDAEAYAALFAAVDGYVPGPEAERTWPPSEDSSKTYATRDYCPVDPDDRLVRLFEIATDDVEASSLQPGTLTLISKDLAVAREAASELASKGPRDQELQGRRSIYFADAAGNEFFVWERPGPPE